VLNAAKNCYAPIIFSKFAEAQLRDAGVECEYVPHGVETGVFQRKPMAEARAAIGLPGDRFIVGMVAANRGIPSRKAFPECIRAFSEFHTKHPEAYLYLHADQAPPGGINLPELCDIYGLRGSVSFVDGYTNHLGLDDGFMVNVFNSMDVLLSPSYGEGFGVPILEAQACGTPVIVGDWTAMPELCRYGWKIDREDATPYYNFEASYQFMPKVGAIVEALEAAFAAGKQHESSVDAEAWARTNYDADVVTRDYWGPALERIHQRQLCGAGELKLVNLG
jgi:glycosyltransferase involved in cell wall biosynthesis